MLNINNPKIDACMSILNDLQTKKEKDDKIWEWMRQEYINYDEHGFLIRNYMRR